MNKFIILFLVFILSSCSVQKFYLGDFGSVRVASGVVHLHNSEVSSYDFRNNTAAARKFLRVFDEQGYSSSNPEVYLNNKRTDFFSLYFSGNQLRLRYRERLTNEQKAFCSFVAQLKSNSRRLKPMLKVVGCNTLLFNYSGRYFLVRNSSVWIIKN